MNNNQPISFFLKLSDRGEWNSVNKASRALRDPSSPDCMKTTRLMLTAHFKVYIFHFDALEIMVLKINRKNWLYKNVD